MEKDRKLTEDVIRKTFESEDAKCIIKEDSLEDKLRLMSTLSIAAKKKEINIPEFEKDLCNIKELLEKDNIHDMIEKHVKPHVNALKRAIKRMKKMRRRI